MRHSPSEPAFHPGVSSSYCQAGPSCKVLFWWGRKKKKKNKNSGRVKKKEKETHEVVSLVGTSKSKKEATQLPWVHTYASKPRHQVTAATEGQGSLTDTSKPASQTISSCTQLTAAFSTRTNITQQNLPSCCLWYLSILLCSHRPPQPVKPTLHLRGDLLSQVKPILAPKIPTTIPSGAAWEAEKRLGRNKHMDASQ